MEINFSLSKIHKELTSQTSYPGKCSQVILEFQGHKYRCYEIEGDLSDNELAVKWKGGILKSSIFLF